MYRRLYMRRQDEHVTCVAGLGCALWVLGADVTPAASPSYSLVTESPTNLHGVPKLWQLGDTPRPSPHPSDANSGTMRTR